MPVYGYQTDYLPSFFSRTSPFALQYNIQNPEELAKALKAKWDLGLHGGALVANPIPEEYSMDEAYINAAIDQALKEADEKGIVGKEITPFLLGKIKDITDGKSLAANIALVKNNAKVGAQLAVSYQKL